MEILNEKAGRVNNGDDSVKGLLSRCGELFLGGGGRTRKLEHYPLYIQRKEQRGVIDFAHVETTLFVPYHYAAEALSCTGR